MFTNITNPVAYLISDPIYTSGDNTSVLDLVLSGTEEGKKPPLPYKFYNFNQYGNSRWRNKAIQVMKLTIIFLISAFLQVSAAGMAQNKITLSEKNAPLEKILEQIRRQSGYDLVFISTDLKNARNVSIHVKQATLEKTLKECFINQPFEYFLDTKTIIIKKKEEPSMGSMNVKADVAGKVVDENGQAIPGANIISKDGVYKTKTDAEGQFKLKDITDGTILVVSYLGYVTKEIKADWKSEMLITLSTQIGDLNDVVVVGYGKQKKQSVVSSISTVKGESLRFPTRSLTNNIAGQVSGIIAIQRSGEPGYDNSEFWIRGISTFAGGSSPLVLVDGVPRKISDIEPDEIETFSVLKDAAATSVYGAEGANGVVIITSKRGKIQKATISFRTEHSISQPTRLPKFVNSADYLTLFNEALANDGQSPIFSDDLITKYRDNADPDLYPNTNWMDALLRKTTENHRYTLNVRGGTERAKYFVSGAYYNEGGIFKDDPDNRYETNIGVKRYNLRSNIDLEISATTTVSVDLSGQYLLTNYPGTGTATIFRQMLITPPYVFPAVYSDGTLATFNKERDINMKNPYNMLMNSGYTKEWRTGIQSNVRLDQKLDFIVRGLSLRGNVSYDYDGNFSSKRSYDPSRFFATGRDENGKLIFSKTFAGTPGLSDPVAGNNATKNIYIESSLNYGRTFGKHNIGALALYMQKESQLYDNPLPFRKQGLVGRLTYSYDNRYFVEGSFGYTGSETFAKDYRFGFFPALGLGYQVSSEPFFPEALKTVVSNLKLRASIGRTGNDNTGGARFLYRPTFNMGAGTFSQGITSGGASNAYGAGITEARFEAPYLSWEIENKQNYGVNLGLLKDKIEIVADYFRSERTGILLQRRTTPTSAGFRQAPWQNFGKVKNWGFDGSIDAHHAINDFKISTRGTFTFARNKITEYDEIAPPHAWMAVTGTRVNENNLYVAERLYTNEDFLITNNSNGTKAYKLKDGIPTPTLGGLIGPGDIKYADLNGDGKIDGFDVQRGIGKPYNPEIVYGFGLNFEYKGLYMSTFLQGTGNSSVILGGNTPEGWTPFTWGVDQSNYRTFATDRWTESNPDQNAFMPRIHSSNVNSANNNVPSTRRLRSGNFLRLKNVELGYNLPKAFLDKIKIRTARVYIMGYNLAVWDDIKFWDPETGNANGGNNYPLPRTYTLGLELTL